MKFGSFKCELATIGDMLAAERRAHVLTAVVDRGAVRVSDLANELEVSEMTIRRDLEYLETRVS